MAILTAYAAMNDDTCKQCGRPLASHRGETMADYVTGWDTCPAMEALDFDQAEKRELDEPERKQGRDPDRARTWAVWRRDEPSPFDN